VLTSQETEEHHDIGWDNQQEIGQWTDSSDLTESTADILDSTRTDVLKDTRAEAERKDEWTEEEHSGFVEKRFEWTGWLYVN